jgi:hypothetical protein
MSRSAVNKHAFAALCFAAGTVSYAQVPASVSSLRVNPTTLVAAELPEAEHLAAALALEKVPAGFVFGAHERRINAKTRMRVQEGAPVTLTNVLDRFLAVHPDYSLGRSDWGLVIQPRSETTCSTALSRVLSDAVIAEPAYIAFWKLARMMNPADTPTAPPAVMCGGGDCNSGVPPAHRARVVVSLSGTTLQEALSQLVAQAPGLVWTLREKRRGRDEPVEVPEASCQFGYFDGDQYIQTSYILGKIA